MDMPRSSSRMLQWGLAAYWFSLNMEGAALLTILIPMTLLQVSPVGHVGQLARIVSLAALFTMIVPPIAGAYSDRQKRRGKRRMPLMWWGTALNVGGLLMIPGVSRASILTGIVLVTVVGQAASQTAYQAMMPEILPSSRWGKASGYMGLASLLGTITGLATAGFAPSAIRYPVLAGIMGIGMMVTTLGVNEDRGPWESALPHVTMGNHKNFIRVFWARFLVMLGQTFLMTYILYFFSEVLHVSQPGAHTAFVGGEALLGAALSTVIIGRLSDRVSRRVVVFLAGLPMAAASLGFALDPTIQAMTLWALLYGVGYGAFLSVDWALGLESIPDLANVARDLGIWGIASNLPAVIAPAVGGWILVHAMNPRQGYTTLFVTAAVMFLLGSVAVLTLGKPSAEKPWSLFLAWLVYILVTPYVRIRYRVHVVGKLALHRHALLVVGNHGQDIEGLVVPLLLFRSRPWGARVISAGSQRLFEPNFFTTRLPERWGYWLSAVNVGPVLWRLGVRPIENQPLFRPITSWAYHIFQTQGNLLASAVFTEEVLTGLAMVRTNKAPLRLRDLWQPRYARQGACLVSVTALQEPYRHQMRQQLAMHIRQQIAELLNAVRDGDLLYLTPEGRYTQDGRVGRFRMLWTVAQQHIPEVVGMATAYDVLRPGPLHVWMRWTERMKAPWAQTILRARRPITASHVVAVAVEGMADESSAMARAKALMAKIPADAQVASDLATRPDEVLTRALHFLWPRHQHGVVCDPRLPGVPDLVQYYRNQWDETIAALTQISVEERQDQTEPE
ncbi:MFS transporter [Sulfobacillus sp. hq2]|uniref:MFS transporter n=1 Tax=Sulfobacillus sp. hq2 TaxID=2039167 RepID=UPI001304DD8B|nr:MFS transporter [Sulfobacillus sp. hq2]